MKFHHKVLFILKILILLGIVLIRFKVIPSDLPSFNIIDITFKIFLSFFVMYIAFPGRKTLYPLDHEDIIFLFACGLVLLFTINIEEYKQSFIDLWNNIQNYRNDRNHKNKIDDDKQQELINKFYRI